METEKMARILYNMSLDMDYADYIEYAEEEINCIKKELLILKENNCDSLLQALEIITMNNENMEFWKNEREGIWVL